MELNPYDSPPLVGLPFVAGCSAVSAFDCVIRERPILAGLFALLAIGVLWQAWRWAR
jgi:hypothetical protein